MVNGGVTTEQQDQEEQRLYDEAQKGTDEDAAPKSAPQNPSPEPQSPPPH
jgi:hypothetical protein